MKIGVLSDLHIDTNGKHLPENETFATLLNNQIKKQQIDLFLIGGDISSDYRVSQAFLDELGQLSGIPILFVPGNHDYWSRNNGETDTKKIYDYFKSQPESILERPYIINDQWAVVGNSGWYDYGFADTNQYDDLDFQKMKLRVGTWQDKRYCDWNESDQAVAQWMLEKMEEDLEKVGDRNVILMTHVVTHPKFVVTLPHKIYDYFNAFLGSSSYGKLYEEYPNIVYSVMGHVHFRKTFFADHVQFICACLGGKKHWPTKSTESEILNAMFTFNLPD
ncbi:MAG: metallophosphoesterase [Carnobacterium sp.]|uniref:metallophosphoesterase n=1 Tax=Carnobacterium sp. TaxID=48221 RepID=UPI002FC8A6D7